ncbi:hypothetical protein DSM110277_01648 [Sulfitobacter pontiacus]|uniref:Competence protein CoiA-like family protein n=1 Tax=Sulfitobacter pontiacus TaxID=60137 RepID=A0AAX3ABG5_9RHOB|nr:competence protein CoiA family protein [Sulfitobacter pontiacus]UOA23234.1 hypothetical protein DSM110277_01648 [Sulfitobacter pontiacus]
MRYASLNSVRVEPSPGAHAFCSCCGADLIAKCGSQKLWHWAHKGKTHCDHWWENETIWHRIWKEQFPASWREAVQTSSSGEKHIADIKAEFGLVVEFQHSPISYRERRSRELFYQRMIWVIDGTRLKSDREPFFKHINVKTARHFEGVEVVEFNPYVPRITRRWMDAEKPVFVDFGDDDLWGISAQMGVWQKFTSKISKVEFVDTITSGGSPLAILDAIT